MKTIRILIIFTLGILLFAACKFVDAIPSKDLSSPPTKDVSSSKTVLDKQREKWIAQNISHYRYSMEFVCLCPGVYWPLTVEIKDGQVVSAIDAAGAPLSSDLMEWYSDYLGVDRLFARIQGWNNGDNKVIVTFYETGAPNHISVAANNCETECTFEITMSNFEKLP